MRERTEDGMGFSGLVPTAHERDAELALVKLRSEIDRLCAVNVQLLAALRGCLAQCVARHDAEGSTTTELMEIEQASAAIAAATGGVTVSEGGS